MIVLLASRCLNMLELLLAFVRGSDRYDVVFLVVLCNEIPCCVTLLVCQSVRTGGGFVELGVLARFGALVSS